MQSQHDSTMVNKVNKKVVVFDFDGTLAEPPIESHDSKRKLFFPETTKLVIEALISNGDLVVLSSHATSKNTMKVTLEEAGIHCEHIIFSDKTDQIYKDNVDGLPEAEAFASPKARLANQLKDKRNFTYAVVVDDQLGIKPEGINAVHILVPVAPNANDRPSSDAYLKMTTLSGAVLEETKNKAIEFKNNVKRGYLDAQQVDTYYASTVNTHSSNDYSFLFQCLTNIAEIAIGVGLIVAGIFLLEIPIAGYALIGVGGALVAHGIFSTVRDCISSKDTAPELSLAS